MTVYTPRTIAFICELLHPPVKPDPAPIQRLHNEMFQSGTPAYTSFQVTPQGPVLSNPVTVPGAVSSASFLADRLVFQEVLGDHTHETFSARVESIVRAVVPARGLQIFTAQQVIVRSLINPRNFKDSRAYLKRGMFGFGGETDVFGREPQMLGMHLVFPGTQEQPHTFNLRIESYHSDPRSLFVENRGTFTPTIVANGLEPIAERVHATYRFLTEKALEFIRSFDARQEA